MLVESLDSAALNSEFRVRRASSAWASWRPDGADAPWRSSRSASTAKARPRRAAAASVARAPAWGSGADPDDTFELGRGFLHLDLHLAAQAGIVGHGAVRQDGVAGQLRVAERRDHGPVPFGLDALLLPRPEHHGQQHDGQHQHDDQGDEAPGGRTRCRLRRRGGGGRGPRSVVVVRAGWVVVVGATVVVVDGTVVVVVDGTVVVVGGATVVVDPSGPAGDTGAAATVPAVRARRRRPAPRSRARARVNARLLPP